MANMLVIKTGTTFASIRSQHGDFEDWFIREMRRPRLDLRVCSVFEGASLPEHDELDGVVITGSPAMVTEAAEWSERTAAWLATAVEQGVPVLGVCYGHQLLGYALGGLVGKLPQGREIGTRTVTLTEAAAEDPLLHAFPLSFPAHLTHQESLLTLPPDAILLAGSELDPHQIFRVGPHAWGVQFHPEFSAEVMRAYLDEQEEKLDEEGWPVRELRGAVTDTATATSLLDRFTQFVMKRA
ncbi:glutamine amidotransferase [Marinobacteraceae bacterium S3BR75-40.1]